ncbi:MAG: hypothetical protein HOV68_02445 [Streptomycetaceae bacterium]|nr:hypothetical protein [Streptomycetaceae bacterium]
MTTTAPDLVRRAVRHPAARCAATCLLTAVLRRIGRPAATSGAARSAGIPRS